MMRRQIVGSVRAAESTTRIAERLLDLDKPVVEMPRYVQELRDAAQFAKEAGDPNLFQQAVEDFRSTVNRLGEKGGRAGQYTVRSAAQQLIKELERAKPEQIEKIVDRWVLDRARYQARVIARNELVEAFRDSYVQTTGGQDYTKGYRWNLSTSHPAADICDIYAEQDIDGLGPGGYLPESIPSTPHTCCICYLTAIMDCDHFKRQIAEAKGTKAPAEAWKKKTHRDATALLKSMPEGKRLEILGPTRVKALKEGKKVVTDRGRILPVYKVMGTPKPQVSRGPSVNVSPIVKSDRASMVRPFPVVPPAKD